MRSNAKTPLPTANAISQVATGASSARTVGRMTRRRKSCEFIRWISEKDPKKSSVSYQCEVTSQSCLVLPPPMPAPRRKFNAHVKRKVAADNQWKCGVCDELLDATFDLDHKIPLHLGGEDTVENLQALHSSCHRQKTLNEEIARLARRELACHALRPPLECTRCKRILSPYFLHRCDQRIL